MSDGSAYSAEALAYFAERAIDPELAAEIGVLERPDEIVFTYRTPDGESFQRRRPLNGTGPAKVVQPKGRKLTPWVPVKRQGTPIVTEGESDALAALSALAISPEVAGLRELPVIAAPGTGCPPERLADAVKSYGSREVFLALDADEAGRRYTEKLAHALAAAAIRPIVIELPDGLDLAAWLAGLPEDERGERFASALVDADLASGDELPAPAPVLLQVLTARALCELPDPPRSGEVLGPLLVSGDRTVLGSYTGEGKTTLALQVLGAVVTRGEFLDWRGAGGPVLVIDAEQGLRTIKRRLREAGLDDREDVDYLRVPDGLALDSDQEEIETLEAILDDGRYAVVLADPLYKLHRGDSNDERHAVDLMRLWDGWRERYGFALFMTTHPRKRPQQGARFTIDELFGSGAYTRGAEVVLGLQRVRPGYGRLHFWKDRDGDLPAGEAWGLLFDREGGFRRDPEDGKAKPTAADRVRELLEADPGMTLEALIGATGYAERTVRDALGSVGAVGTGKPKRWTLPVEQEGLL